LLNGNIGNLAGLNTAYKSDLCGAINEVNKQILRVDCSISVETFADAVPGGTMQYFRMRNSEPASTWNYSIGIIFAPTSTEKIIVMFKLDATQIVMKCKSGGTWTGWKAVGLT